MRKYSNSFTIRDTSAQRDNAFRRKLENTNWDFYDQANNAKDPNTAYNVFIDKYTGLFDTCFPFKTIKGKALNIYTHGKGGFWGRGSGAPAGSQNSPAGTQNPRPQNAPLSMCV